MHEDDDSESDYSDEDDDEAEERSLQEGCFAALYGEATRRLGASAGESVEMGLR